MFAHLIFATWFFHALIIHHKEMFARLIFAAKATGEKFLTAKISRSTISVKNLLKQSPQLHFVGSFVGSVFLVLEKGNIKLFPSTVLTSDRRCIQNS